MSEALKYLGAPPQWTGLLMDELDFEISEEAVRYLRKYLLREDIGMPVVLTIAPTTGTQTMEVDPKKVGSSEEALATLGQEHLNSLASPLRLKWSIGATRKSRLPKDDIFVISGIECFLPEDLRSAVKGRVLRVEGGKLVFDPPLAPPAQLDPSRL